jgi:WD40 repeat protein
VAQILAASDGGIVRRIEAGREHPSVAFAPDGRLLLVSYGQMAGSPGYLVQLELRDAERDTVLASDLVVFGSDFPCGRGALFRGPQGRRIYLGRHCRAAYRWEPGGEPVRLFEHDEEADDFAVSDDERLAVTTSGKRARVWSLPAGTQRATLEHPLKCKGVALLPGPRILTACNDGVARVWDEAGGLMLELALGMGKLTCLDVSPDGMTFACGVEKNKRVVLMDVPE